MKEIAVSELSISDVGSRVIVIDQAGNAYDGTLTGLGGTTWEYGKRPEERIHTSISVESVKHSELKLRNLPLDFRLQVERSDNELES